MSSAAISVATFLFVSGAFLVFSAIVLVSVLGRRDATVACATGIVFAFVVTVEACRPTSAIDGGVAEVPVEAAVEVVDGTCTLLEGLTKNQTVLTICATVEELATVAAFVASFLRPASVVEAEPSACTVVANTCATRAELGPAIELILRKRDAKRAALGPMR